MSGEEVQKLYCNNAQDMLHCFIQCLYNNQYTVDQQSPTSLTCFDLITSSLSAHRQPFSLRMTAVITISGWPCLRWL